MDKQNLKLRVDDIAPRNCYWCFNTIEQNQNLKVFNHLPHHDYCIKETINDKRRFDLINELLEYYQLYQSEQFIKDILEYADSKIKNYVLDFKDTHLVSYVLTTDKFMKISSSLDYYRKYDDYLELSIDELLIIEKLFN